MNLKKERIKEIIESLKFWIMAAFVILMTVLLFSIILFLVWIGPAVFGA